jgi:hypothetical protein
MLFNPIEEQRNPSLKANSTFKIVQFADLHFGEDETYDRKTKALMRSVLSTEQPDFIVFSGDQISGYAIETDESRISLWIEVLSVAEEFQIPFATIFGNHDDQLYHLDSLRWNHIANIVMAFSIVILFAANSRKTISRVMIIPVALAFGVLFLTTPSRTLRTSMHKHERSRFSNLSYSAHGPQWLHGASNYRVLVQAPNASAALYFLDSGGGRIPDAIHADQIRWLERLPAPRLPAIAFVHIPPADYTGLYATGRCDGPPPREPVSTCAGSEALVGALEDLGARAVFAGHDHGNAWCCGLRGVRLCYGRHSGYGGYDFEGDWRGARVIELGLEGERRLSVATRVRDFECGRGCL